MSFDYAQLDDGVRDLVRLLRENGFNTTDSGDGYSKSEPARTHSVPHVYMTFSDLTTARDQAFRLVHLLEERGIVLGEPHKPGVFEAMPWLELSWTPFDDVPLLGLFHVDDSML